MDKTAKLTAIKLLHTAIWFGFNIVIFYMLYAAVIGNLDKWLWLGYGLIFAEGIVLLIFKSSCPLTVAARRYSDSTRENFDIYLPRRLAANNKLIYTTILIFVSLVVLYRLLS